MKLKTLFAFLFIGAGIMHFLKTDIYAGTIPPFFPQHRLLVLGSGAASVLLGIGLLVPPVSKLAAWGILLFLVAVFPANIYMALHPEIFRDFPVWVFMARLPLQAVLVNWAYGYTK